MNAKAAILWICVLLMINESLWAGSFDWRNVSGKDYVTGVKDQGLCGSCWAYAAVATVEAQYNIFWDWPGYDINLSEENLVSRCYLAWNCNGGRHDDALDYIEDTGITDEACFPYVDSACRWKRCADDIPIPCTYFCTDADCTGDFRCAQWQDRLWDIDDYVAINASEQAIKNYIRNTGPVAVAIDYNNSEWDDDIEDMRICNETDETTHCITLVGYDDDSEYWIAKNSWGADWGPNGNGYFKIGYGECLIETVPYGATLSNPSTDIFCIKSSSGTMVASFRSNGDLVLKGTLSDNDTPAATASDEFIVKDSSGTIIATIDMSTGDVVIQGDLDEYTTESPGTDDFIVKDSSGTVVAFIDEATGDLCLEGKLFQEPEPPDDEL